MSEQTNLTVCSKNAQNDHQILTTSYSFLRVANVTVIKLYKTVTIINSVVSKYGTSA
jgi:hypothetical protein